MSFILIIFILLLTQNNSFGIQAADNYNPESIKKMIDQFQDMNPMLLQKKMSFLDIQDSINQDQNMTETPIMYQGKSKYINLQAPQPKQKMSIIDQKILSWDEKFAKLQQEIKNDVKKLPFSHQVAVQSQQNLNFSDEREKMIVKDLLNKHQKKYGSDDKFKQIQETGEKKEQVQNEQDDFQYNEMDEKTSKEVRVVNREIKKQISSKMKLFAAIQCWKGTPPDLKSELLKKSEIAVYVPIPVFKYYHIPVLQHYPLHQLVKQAVPIPINVDVTHDIKKLVPHVIPVEQKIVVPQPVPFADMVGVPTNIPVYTETNVIPHYQSITGSSYDPINALESLMDPHNQPSHNEQKVTNSQGLQVSQLQKDGLQSIGEIPNQGDFSFKQNQQEY